MDDNQNNSLTSPFAPETIVRLTFDHQRRFQVISDELINGKVRVAYFNERVGRMVSTYIESKFLETVKE